MRTYRLIPRSIWALVILPPISMFLGCSVTSPRTVTRDDPGLKTSYVLVVILSDHRRVEFEDPGGICVRKDTTECILGINKATGRNETIDLSMVRYASISETNVPTSVLASIGLTVFIVVLLIAGMLFVAVRQVQ